MLLLSPTQWVRIPAFRQTFRTIFSETGVVEPHLQYDTLHNVEKHWKPKLQSSLPTPKKDASKYYVLSMFPYPSGSKAQFSVVILIKFPMHFYVNASYLLMITILLIIVS